MEINICDATHIASLKKAKEMHYKITHGHVTTNHLLYKMNIMNSDKCSFCKHYEQTVFHLFYDSNHVKRFCNHYMYYQCTLSFTIIFSLFHLPYSYLSDYIRSRCLDIGLQVSSHEPGGM